MWKYTGVSLLVLVLLDLPWVLLNTRYGAYKGHVNGRVSHPAIVGVIWLTIMIAEAFLLGYIVSTARTWWLAMLAGMFVGFVVYFTFNGTSLVTFNTWPARVALVDTAWGVFLMGAAALVAFLAIGKSSSTFDPDKQHPAFIS